MLEVACANHQHATCPNRLHRRATRLTIDKRKLAKRTPGLERSDAYAAIGYLAFSFCDELTTITLPRSVTSIGEGTFFGCSNLTLTVDHDSYALQYARENDVPYTYPDANDWLND